jgi:hypothetical protein
MIQAALIYGQRLKATVQLYQVLGMATLLVLSPTTTSFGFQALKLW